MTPTPAGIFARQLAEVTDVLDNISPEAFTAVAETIAAAPAVFLSGRGRNGLALRGFANRLMQVGKPAAILGDILTGPVRHADLVILASGSGTTTTLIEIAVTTQSLGATVIALTGNPETPLANQADVALTIPANLSTSAQPLGTLFEQCLSLVCDALVVDLMHRLNASVEAMRTRHANIE